MALLAWSFLQNMCERIVTIRISEEWHQVYVPVIGQRNFVKEYGDNGDDCRRSVQHSEKTDGKFATRTANLLLRNPDGKFVLFCRSGRSGPQIC
jgi:hypothetical protein